MIYLPKKVCLIIIHRNTTHLLDMSCIYEHQQQRCNNESTKICVFMHYMYVDILFPLTKAIPIKFERVSSHCHTLHTWMGHNAARHHNFNELPHALSYIFSQFSLVFGLFTTGYHTLPSNL